MIAICLKKVGTGQLKAGKVSSTKKKQLEEMLLLVELATGQ